MQSTIRFGRRGMLQGAVGTVFTTLISAGAPAQAHRSGGLVVPEHEGTNWEMSPGRSIQYKLMSSQTGENISVFEETVPAGAGTPLHIHRTSDEIIYLKSGKFTVRLETEVTIAGPGSWIYIPKGMTHGWRNHGDAPARAAYMFTPAHGGKVFEESRSLGHVPSDDPATMARLQELMKRYGYVMVSPDWR